MTHDPKEGRGTVAELRALLDKATPGPWTARNCDEYDHAERAEMMACYGLRDSDGKLIRKEDRPFIAALRNAAPDLLRVVEAVAKIDNGYFFEQGCPFCGADNHMGGYAGIEHMKHESDCAWLLARKLTGAP